MLYVSSKKNDLLGITDSADGVEEFYTPDKVRDIVKNLKLNIWGFVDENNSFVVDINKFLNIIKNCTLFYKNLDLGDTVTVPMVNANNFYKGTTCKEAYNKFLKAFNSDISFGDALKFLTLKVKWGNFPLTKFMGVRYTGFPNYESIDIFPNSVVITKNGNKYVLRDLDNNCGKPYIKNIEVRLLDSNFDIVCHNLPYGESV